MEGHVPDCPPRCPEWLYKEIMIPCWDQDRTHRPSAADVLELIAGKRSLLHYIYWFIDTNLYQTMQIKRAGNQLSLAK